MFLYDCHAVKKPLQVNSDSEARYDELQPGSKQTVFMPRQEDSRSNLLKGTICNKVQCHLLSLNS